jgi:TorA maturation chaperone TorD
VEKMKIDALLFRESARRDTYKAFAESFHLPDNALSTQIDSLEKHLGVLGSKAFSHTVLLRHEYQGPGDLEKLRVDFSRLFIGPYRLLAPPYGSIYLEKDHKVMENSTVDARERYRQAGLDISAKFKDAPDHIAAELEFMYFLIFKEIEAIYSDAPEAAYEQFCRQRSFLNNHLGLWATDFAQKVEKHAETDFYCNLAIAMRTFIAEDVAEIANIELPEPMDHEY